MRIKVEKYSDADGRLPKAGQHILGYQENDQIVVYQAYNHFIADYALKNQTFGGTHYSFNRMSWIKPNFLWMMYRCGWATKENQERVLAIWLHLADFESVLRQAVFSSFNAACYSSHDAWRKELTQKEVRLQWDPDHNPFGEKLTRRAIQIGMKGKTLEAFCTHQVKRIEDITDFVKEQKLFVDAGKLSELLVPVETVYNLSNDNLRMQIGVD